MPTANRTESGGFATTEGTLYVSKPFRSKSSKKTCSTITFTPRKAISKGWIRYYWTVWVSGPSLPHGPLPSPSTWARVLTILQIMIMKMHSYMSTNGYLQYVPHKSDQVLKQLRHATTDAGGWN
ncbi:hypothetical protein BV22DRAFT_679971 [Leucogyrophana mollusca]|uniref:Uncharacterized protein n=1 Tax=Leucogyrophana mollusca TaxID=85980 RepID=A0ACB8B8P8_9AGAM|nr:hypothetical protein BV22DRAFT_679971 [Leucogyrophana mollusca]